MSGKPGKSDMKTFFLTSFEYKGRTVETYHGKHGFWCRWLKPGFSHISQTHHWNMQRAAERQAEQLINSETN